MKKYDIERFTKRYEKDIPMYKAWGEYVQKKIEEKLDWKTDMYQRVIKIPVEPRVKTIDSIITKAFFRNKEYENPYEDITDKVGIRFVVMLESQVEYIKRIVESIEDWDASKDKDYEELQKESPEYFGYQSVHFVVRNKEIVTYNSILIEEGTPCEVQIRTLEQHAHAEMSHDYVYKSKKEIDFKIKRYLARSMALNEAVDELFGKVYEKMDEDNQLYKEFTEHFLENGIFDGYSEKLNKAIYDNICSIVQKRNISVEDVKGIEKPFIIQGIKSKAEDIIFKQPVIVLVYYLAKNYGSELKEIWDSSDSILEMIYCDLGISFDS